MIYPIPVICTQKSRFCQWLYTEGHIYLVRESGDCTGAGCDLRKLIRRDSKFTMYCWIRFLLAGVNENGGLSGRNVASPAIKESRSIAFEYNASALPLFSMYSSTWNTGKIYLVRDFVVCKQDYRCNMKKKIGKRDGSTQGSLLTAPLVPTTSAFWKIISIASGTSAAPAIYITH